MKRVLLIHLDSDDGQAEITLLGERLLVLRRGCAGEADRARALIAEFDGQVDAIALQGMPASLQLGPAQIEHAEGRRLAGMAKHSPVVDGGGVRAALERSAIALAHRAQPGLFARKRALMVPGLNHSGLSQALERQAASVHFADPFVYFGWPRMPGVGSGATLNQAARAQLDLLKDAPFRRIYPQPGGAKRRRAPVPFLQADILAGDIGPIRRYTPTRLDRKVVVVNHATDEDMADLRARGAATLVTLMPPLDTDGDLGRWPASVIEAGLVALRAEPGKPLSEDIYLDLLADLHWTPAIVHLQPEDENINRFAFVIHPLNMGFIHKHPVFGIFTKRLPSRLVEETAAYMPPMHLAKITGGQSPTTGTKIEGHLITLAATPRMMMKHNAYFTYRRLHWAARIAERRGARIMGLGAFTSVVGDAGVTVAHEADIAITSGNSLTVAATLESAKIAARMMGAEDLSGLRLMVVGATGSIASACSRLAAMATRDVVLVSIEPEKLIELKRTIQRETPGARVTIATRTADLVADCDVIITATSAFGQRVIDVTQCKPGAVICDVARPLDINPAEAALRPDILVIESGEVLIPGDVDFGYDIGLPPKTAYACLAETALLAMDGRFEDFTLGRNLDPNRVKEIWRLYNKHQFQLAPIRSFGDYVTEAEVAEKRAIADRLRGDAALLARTKAEAAEKLKDIPVMAKGIGASRSAGMRWISVDAGIAALATWAAGVRRRFA